MIKFNLQSTSEKAHSESAINIETYVLIPLDGLGLRCGFKF